MAIQFLLFCAWVDYLEVDLLEEGRWSGSLERGNKEAGERERVLFSLSVFRHHCLGDEHGIVFYLEFTPVQLKTIPDYPVL